MVPWRTASNCLNRAGRLNLRSTSLCPPSFWPSQWVDYQCIASRQCQCPAVRNDAASSATDAQGVQQFDMRVHREQLPAGKSKLRLDSYLASCLSAGSVASRAKVHSAIQAGQVTVNGRVVNKPSTSVSPGDAITCILLPSPSLEAMPEHIPLDIVYEDEHLMVINKPAGMPVHISAGHHSGTLVNALLAHCGLPGVRIDPTYPSNIQTGQDSDSQSDGHSQQGLGGIFSLETLSAAASETSTQTGKTAAATSTQSNSSQRWMIDSEQNEDEDEASEEDLQTPDAMSLPGTNQAHPAKVTTVAGSLQQSEGPGVLRPGIVHRLDMGTSGLLVVAKREVAQRHLSAQFKARTVERYYESFTIGCPSVNTGRVMTNIDRDSNDRKRMAAFPYGGTRGRTASSNYTVLEQLGAGAAALVQWKLDTGRTHQIRVHAKHLGHPLIGDVTYGGAVASAVSAMTKQRPSWQPQLKSLLAEFSRPALHARSLAFDHPVTGKRLSFECDMPDDMQTLLANLQSLQ